MSTAWQLTAMKRPLALLDRNPAECAQVGLRRREELLLKFRFSEALDAALATHRQEVGRSSGLHHDGHAMIENSWAARA